jgi:hypothetical protein
MPKPVKAPFDRVLLVEGSNDQHVVWALCKQYSVPEAFEVSLPREGRNESSGVEALLRELAGRLQQSDLKILGIVVDADQDLEARWQSIYARLTTAGYANVPQKPVPNGLILESPDQILPRFGAWLMPDNQTTGILEDFIRQLIPANDPLKPEADRILNEIESAKIQRYTVKDRAKAFIHTWLAWQESPGRPMGQTITAKVLEKDAPIAATFTHWLTQLFISG